MLDGHRVFLLVATALTVSCGANAPPSDVARSSSGSPTSTQKSRVDLVFENDMSSSFILVSLSANVDGASVYARNDEPKAGPTSSTSLDDIKRQSLFSDDLAPGDHRIDVVARYVGRCSGTYDYCRYVPFDVRSSHDFAAREGGAARVVALAYEKGSVTTPLEDRPAIRFEGT